MTAFFTTGDGTTLQQLATSWTARQVVLAALNVVVTVSPEQRDQPRWVTDLRSPSGIHVRGSSRERLSETENLSTIRRWCERR